MMSWANLFAQLSFYYLTLKVFNMASPQPSLSADDWTTLAATFTPQVFLCTTYNDDFVESYYPSTIDYYLNNSALHCQGNEQPKPITASQLANCNQSSDNGYIDSPKSTWSGLMDTAPETKGSSTQVLKSPFVVHIRNASGGKVSPGQIDIQYWFFYCYNGSVPAKAIAVGIFDTGLGKHQGDWEHITVRLPADWRTNFHNNTPVISSIYYAAHNNEGKWIDSNLKLYDKTHPIVYSAWHSHASYDTTGLIYRPEDKLKMGPVDLTSQGQQWGPYYYDDASSAQNNMVSWAAIDSDVYNTSDGRITNAAWLPFNGRWGATSDSPPNPAIQGYWTADPAA